MISHLRARNFKSWADTGDINLAPLTGLFGANSSGKTSLLQILLLLKQTTQSSDRKRTLDMGGDRSLVDLGTFRDLIHSHNADLALQLEIKWCLNQKLKVHNPDEKKEVLFETDNLSFTSNALEQKSKLIVDKFEYAFDDYRFGMERILEGKGIGKYKLISASYDARRIQGRPWPLPHPVKLYGFPDEVKGKYQNVGFLSDFVLAFEDLFSGMAYLGPLREYPKRSYLWGGDDPGDVGLRGEQAVAALLATRVQGKTFSPGKHKNWVTVEERIAYWLRKMGLIHSYSLKPIAENRRDYELRIQRTPNGTEVLITDVGFGVSQILPVLVLCYYAPEGSVLLLEQPEIHLHPYVQAFLADVFIEVVKRRKLQIIVESHSEHLLRRLQRRIAEEALSADDAALYFCSTQEDVSKLERLEVDLFGNISNWPRDFFGDELGELAAMIDAQMKREQQ